MKNSKPLDHLISKQGHTTNPTDKSFPVLKVFVLYFFLGTVANSYFVTPLAEAQNDIPIEYKVKAAYIYKFFQFIDWSANNESKPQQPYRIGVFGDSQIYPALLEFSKTAEGQNIKLVRINKRDSLIGLHSLFIGKNFKGSKREIFNESQALNILTIGEENSFCMAGGMINFVILEGKVKFEINRQAAKKAGIKVSSRILKAAIKVYSEQN